MQSTPPNRLSVRVTGVLAEETDAEPTLLDELLTECAAEALMIRARILKHTRQLNELFSRAREERAREEAEALLAHNERAWEEGRTLAELIGDLRARRRASR